MNKKMFIGLASSALTLGIAAYVGVSSNAKVEAKADGEKAIKAVYLKGSFNGWGEVDPLTPDINGDYKISKKINADQTFKLYVTGPEDTDTRWIGYDWDLANCDYGFVGESDDNFKALTDYTLTFTVKHTFYTNWGADVSIQLGEPRTVQFVDSSEQVIAETENLVEEGGQFTGMITTTVANTKIKIKDTITGSTPNYYAALEDDVTVATPADGCIQITSPGTYMVYYKKNSDHKCWIEAAGTSQTAYYYANYFLDYVGCDPDGIATPTGWETCKSRYALLSNEVKDYIYDAENQTEYKVGDALDQMIKRYEWAINHNPNSLTPFITDKNGTARKVYSGSVATITSNQSNSSNWALVAVAGSALLASGAFFLLRRKSEE